MFIELHVKSNGAAITIDIGRIEYFTPDNNDEHTMLSMFGHDHMLTVEETYDQVKEVIANVTRS